MPAEKVGAGIAEQVALARRESPTRGSRHLGLAKALVHEMPNTHQALTDGVITEWAATLVAQATACLSVDDRATVDAALAARMGELSDVRLGKAAQALAYQADPLAWVTRGRRAAGDRRVSVRPAPDVNGPGDRLRASRPGSGLLQGTRRACPGGEGRGR